MNKSAKMPSQLLCNNIAFILLWVMNLFFHVMSCHDFLYYFFFPEQEVAI